MKLQAIGLLVGAVVVVALWVANCSGPEAEVTSVQLLEPATESAPYRVQVAVQNQGPGHGEVNVIARLRDHATGYTFQESRTAALEAKETTLVVVEVYAPRGSYSPEVEVEYPPH